MKFKVLEDFFSSILHGFKGDVHDVELDDHTAQSWKDSGLIEEVKQKDKKNPAVPDSSPPVEDVNPDDAK